MSCDPALWIEYLPDCGFCPILWMLPVEINESFSKVNLQEISNHVQWKETKLVCSGLVCCRVIDSIVM